MPTFTSSTNMEKVNVGSFGYSAVKIDDLLASEYTLVSIAVDLSSSVGGLERDIEACLKSIIQSCQKSPRANNLLVRVLTFGNDVQELHGWTLLSQINLGDYDNQLQAKGMTALVDAVINQEEGVGLYGQTLTENEFLANSVSFTITDGMENRSRFNVQKILSTRQDNKVGEKLESSLSILVGLSPGNCSNYLKDFKDQAGFDQYVEVQDATPETLGKLANFASQSISSTSTALGTGQASQPINPSTVF